MGCLFPPAQVFNDLCPTLFRDVIFFPQPRVLGKQYSVITVQKCYLLRREQLRMRQDKKKQWGFIGGILHSSKTCLPKCCHSPANHVAIVLVPKVITKTRSSTQTLFGKGASVFLRFNWSYHFSCGSSSSWSNNMILWRGIYFSSSTTQYSTSSRSAWPHVCWTHFIGCWIRNRGPNLDKGLKDSKGTDNKQCLKCTKWRKR